MSARNDPDRDALASKLAGAQTLLERCTACPRECGVDREQDEEGACATGREARVASAGPHFGEESVLVGRRGSGTIFFAGCNLRCVFCQNADISQGPGGERSGPVRLAAIALELQNLGCHNLNLVTPEHVVPQVVAALVLARQQGLCLPVVHNTSAYDSIESLRLLEGLVDVYMPDFKFWETATAARYTGAPDYPATARAAIAEMHRQVGALTVDPDGVARSGVLVRHLVMPGLGAETRAILDWLAREISPDTFVNVMDQYRPCHLVGTQYGELNRRPSREELDSAREAARDAGLWRLDGEWP